jgi:hypothetical protein
VAPPPEAPRAARRGANETSPSGLTAGARPSSRQELIHIDLYDLETERLVYRGFRECIEAGDKVTIKTTYKKPDGSEVQRTESVYERETLKLVSHVLADRRLGREEQIRVSGKKITLRYQEKKGEPAQSEELEWETSTSASPVLVAMMARNAELLMGGDALVFDLIVPSRLETIGFRLKKDADGTVAGKPVTIIRMEPDSWLIRQLVDPMFFYLTSAAPHRLLQYTGRVSIKTDEGEDQDLRSVYRYPAKS